MRSKEYLAAVRADGDLLVLETLFFADEIRDAHDEIDNLPGQVKLSAQERRIAGQLIDSLSGRWRPSDYRDTYTDRVNDLIDAKKHHKDIQPAAEAPAATNVADLTQALRASLEAAHKPAVQGATASRPRANKTASATKPSGKATEPTKQPDRTEAPKTRPRKTSATKQATATKPTRKGAA
jgi:DNA end-binding protein Ku